MSFDLVLYYTQSTKPLEPIFEDIQINNPGLEMDELLDIFSDKKNEFNVKISTYNNRKPENIDSFIVVPNDENFAKIIGEIESSPNFISWTDNSNTLIASNL